MRLRSLSRVLRSLPLVGLSVSLSLPAFAVEQPATSSNQSDDDDKENDPQSSPTPSTGEIVVRAPRIAGQVEIPQQPVQTFEEEDIAAYGVNSIQELLDAISPQTGSGRGRGDGQPIILLNGQRISSQREMRNIPPEALRKIEVLPEEAALRFGYPPNQRVVNIILKSQFKAATASTEYNRPTSGGYDNVELESGLFKIAGQRRYNVSAKLDQTSMLTENERGVIQQSGTTPTVAGDPDPAQYRSLSPRDLELQVEGTMTQTLGKDGVDGSITVTGGYTRSQKTSLSGLDTVTLTDPAGNSAIRTLSDPLTRRDVTDTFEGGLGYSKGIGLWQLSTTANLTIADEETRTDRRRDTSGLQAQALAGTLAIDGALPAVAGAGVDVATSRSVAVTSLATITGKPFSLPAGDAFLTVKGGYNYTRNAARDSRNDLGSVVLTRGDVSTGVNLALPITSRSYDFLGAVGDITLNFSAGLDKLSDFGTLTDWSAGLTWSPTDTLTFQASYIVDQEAPSLSNLGSPNTTSYNVAVYDYTRGVTSLVTTTSGGNPDLLREKQRDWKISGQWKLPFVQRGSLLVEYFRNRSTDVTETFPVLTSAVEAAFPDRVTRDSNGNLIAVDQRPVTYDEVKSSRLRWGINLTGNLGGASGQGGGPGGSGPGGGGEAGSRRSTPAASAPVAVVGPQGPMPGDTSAGAGTGGQRPGFDPARMTALRQQLCAPGAKGDVDPATLSEGMRARVSGPDGKIDPQKLAELKTRFCANPGGGQGQDAGPGGFDPERFAKIRAALCTQGSGPPDVSALPERMREGIIGADGKVDPAKLSALRERVCSQQASGQGANGQARQGGQGQGGPVNIGALMGGMSGGGFGGPPPATGSSGRSGQGSGGPGAGVGAGPGGGGMGGPPGGGFGGRGRGGNRWNLAVYHTWQFTDTVRIAPGAAVLDQLNGQALTAGGVPRHSIEAEGGVFVSGYGLRLKAEWDAPARVDGSDQSASSSLRFGSTFDVTARLFADLNRIPSLTDKMPFLKGGRIALKFDNLLNSRQRVTDGTGATPIAYQRAYRDPQGRVIGIDFRKMF
ncbi:hypothetical protein WSK_0879 [Novosphingobium sp. Rr 2-17]|uniref:TonB-dependent receptor domain-containing protein n=1 Tax=Novosphingobium sp. Rr 2-17 TaxID=555793 RepID=UPI0002698E84|nr:TonB-dependent receptor [Novosphingobium sp. Rr 2-17]EIZ80600.1 hypothetical protein WSK_0879 [Novosphingobium sp. Rr 2-17]